MFLGVLSELRFLVVYLDGRFNNIPKCHEEIAEFLPIVDLVDRATSKTRSSSKFWSIDFGIAIGWCKRKHSQRVMHDMLPTFKIFHATY